jgi:low affinity Fe/Cu permease
MRNEMARARTRSKAAASRTDDKSSKVSANENHARHGKNTWSDLFSRAACATAHLMGKPITFLIAVALVVIWAATGPLFGFSDTWQLVINTSTTIVTFLMVFLIQNTQNRDTMALQLKLSELILVISAAENRFASAEDLSEEELEALHEELRGRAEHTLGTLNERRAAQTRKAS